MESDNGIEPNISEEGTWIQDEVIKVKGIEDTEMRALHQGCVEKLSDSSKVLAPIRR